MARGINSAEMDNNNKQACELIYIHPKGTSSPSSAPQFDSLLRASGGKQINLTRSRGPHKQADRLAEMGAYRNLSIDRRLRGAGGGRLGRCRFIRRRRFNLAALSFLW